MHADRNLSCSFTMQDLILFHGMAKNCFTKGVGTDMDKYQLHIVVS